MNRITRVAGLYAIADTSLIAADRLADAVVAALRGGARVVQLRAKGGAAKQHRHAAQALAELCRAQAVPFIVNDDPRLAVAVGADGVHLGREDTDIAAARRIVGATALIGVSCYNRLDAALAAEKAGANYIAFGSFFASVTKPQAVHAPIELLTAARAQLHVPIVAIGGITPANGAALITAGADALAVISGVFAQRDIEAAARKYAALFADADMNDQINVN